MTFNVSVICETTESRDRLVEQLKPMPDVQIHAHVGGVRQLQLVMQQDKPDAVVLEQGAPDESAFATIEVATTRASGVMLLLVSTDTSLATIKRAMRAGVRDVLPGPLNTDAVSITVDFLRESRANQSTFATHEGALFAFVPAKGGCGNTFIASNLAYQLAESGKRVLVIDLNLYFGDTAACLSDQRVETSVVDVARQAHRLDAALLNASVLKAGPTLHVLTAPELPYQVEEVTPDRLAAIVGLARTEYDFVLLDLSRTFDPTTVKALDLAERVFMVTQQTLPAVQDAKRVVKVFEGLGYSTEKVQVVVNRFIKGNPISVDDVEQATRLKVARVVPASGLGVLASVNQGVALVKLAPKDPVAKVLRDWAQELSPVTVKAGAKSWFANLRGTP
ncbi:AAA family ATPase [Hydrogenophaga sp. PBL-H3]|uniref:AAA family ATPase n=1 Tax=Hydrogenophaga sp. PBL-H3 TaxID=434010 RepID=UPI00131FED0A|nr:AAA family ATPase [Hydrogenophaga sp. PBL-H3]QHE76511.1 AAA family ATPase [Hydrogenophaga sp. PBL-H3]QHE80935.1 AAA family ATPase [Hydrogenophaga sp. PBL-H3]